mmetsp:Transcript_707/g.1628  ORF Transcript_707/g.1628 Transcript_707/m.1628 type:complete len:484 (-) Transcript_707:252-1703(-)|eukprot:CAMPEP_0168173268 /NCGR_PEP_ID=MMETSP0139_2-20121125/5784_1 /TAXON_ID=44445 /ORGANISM="Pseudo-nitzschia australis, Strain 10249 10 AB" /LENGTH=483 /DNA_ID=CAMNT_0008091149 /DNA_START=650 /DNA_END=2101 /DNA_ORIENTATION=+
MDDFKRKAPPTDEDQKPAARSHGTGQHVAPDAAPEWRSVSVQIDRPTSLAGVNFRRPHGSEELITTTKDSPSSKLGSSTSNKNWWPTRLRPVPPFYPLDRSSRFIADELEIVVNRISEANRVLSIHAQYDNENATAELKTSENGEMFLSLFKTSNGQEGVCVEIQRRKGDSISYHRYARCILDVAAGELDIKEHVKKNGDDIDLVYIKKVNRLNNLEVPNDAASERGDAIVAVEIAHGLLMKDRMDARLLGLESLCLLTDPRKTGSRTALITSRVVLLGTPQIDEEDFIDGGDETPFQEIQKTILSLVQFRRIGEESDFDDDKGESSEEEHITILHNLALAVLANALDVILNEDMLAEGDFSSPSAPEEVTRCNRRRIDTAESISERFLEDSLECGGGSESKEIMKTLITELGKANMKPHNACLSAKCLRSLCRASDKARNRAKELGAKAVVQTALDVGTRTHLKLERECSKVMTELKKTNTE